MPKTILNWGQVVNKLRKSDKSWQVFNLEELVAKVQGEEARILEFLRVPGMSCAVYHLPRECKDMQSPHAEDEIYLVLQGKGSLLIDEQRHNIQQGTLLFVQANTAHSFFDIEEDITVLAFFGPQG